MVVSSICDAVIGADGIWGVVREHVLGDAAGEHAPTNAGWWDCRNLVPLEKAKQVLGDEFFKVNRAVGWAGHGAFIMHVVRFIPSDDFVNRFCLILAPAQSRSSRIESL